MAAAPEPSAFPFGRWPESNESFGGLETSPSLSPEYEPRPPGAVNPRWGVWRMDYNDSRPHMALGNLIPAEYLAGSGFCMDPMGSMQVGS